MLKLFTFLKLFEFYLGHPIAHYKAKMFYNDMQISALSLCHALMSHVCLFCVMVNNNWFFWKAENLSPWSFLDMLFRKMQEPLSNRQMSWWLDDHVFDLCKQHSQRGFTIHWYFITNIFSYYKKCKMKSLAQIVSSVFASEEVSTKCYLSLQSM